MSGGTLLYALCKRLLKTVSRSIPGWRLRVTLLKLAGYKIGTSTYIGEDFLVVDEPRDRSMVIIGDRVAIAPRVTIVASSYANFSRLRDLVGEKHLPVIIESDSWIGTGAIILPGVTIAPYTVVAAGAVVTKSFPSRSIIGGVPAKIISTVPERHSTHLESQL